MIRYRMNKILKLLKSDDIATVKQLVQSDKYEHTLRSLSDIGCVKITRAWGGDIVNMKILDHSFTYQLERFDLWLNRIIGFICGIITTIVGQFIISLLIS